MTAFGRARRAWSKVRGRLALLAICLPLTVSACCSTTRGLPPGGSPEPLIVHPDEWAVTSSVAILPSDDFWAIMENRKRWVDYARALELMAGAE